MVSHKEEPFSEFVTKKKSKKKKNEPSLDTTNEISKDTQCNDMKKSKKKPKTDIAQYNAISFVQSETTNLVSRKKKKFSDKNVTSTHPEDNEEGTKKKDKLEEDVLCNLQTNKTKKKHISEEDIRSSDCVTDINVTKKKKKKNAIGGDLGSRDLTTKTDENMTKKKKIKKRTLEECNTLDVNKCEDIAPKKKTLKKDDGSSGLLTDMKDDTEAISKTISEQTRILEVNISNKKKKKRTKKTATLVQISDGDNLATMEETMEQDVCLTEDKRRKKEKKEIASYSYKSNDATDNANSVDDFSDQLKKKKERKKAKDHCKENNEVAEDNGDAVVVVKSKQKKSRNRNESKESDVSVPHKKKKKNGMSQPEENTEMLNGKNDVADVVVTKAVKKKQKQASEVTVDAEVSDTVAKVSETAGAKKKKKVSSLVAEDQYNAGNGSHLCEVLRSDKGVCNPAEMDNGFTGTLSGMNNNVTASLVTRKNKKRKLASEEDAEGCGNLSENETEVKMTDSSQVLKEGVKAKKSKHKKSKEKAMLTVDTDNCQNTDSHGEDKKKKLKKKKVALLPEEQNTDKESIDIPKKKKKRKEGTDILVAHSSSTAAIEEHDTEVQVVSVKPGCTDEINIDTERRKVLQQHVDRESGQKKGTKFGQWDTASFHCSEQQTKFLRLLGGFKKENQSLPPKPSHQEKFNMALGKTGEKALERSLLAEFDKALSWKQNRGIGLGFAPEQKKTFHIDKTASRSVKFED
ncbi:lysine-rich nucleolar protein 1 [Hyperolius riggenbachi]|uniref:lysine-rich nucleolar protein 1 n=1 Tax=Hyperolius riggenbachi TaxID=752182 RepID=UPI0035A2D8F9